MPLVTKTSPAAQTALYYITAGALVLVWSGVWLVWLWGHTDSSSTSYYFCTGTILTGLALLVIGLLLGPIGKASKPAEQPAEVAVQTDRQDDGTVTTSAPAPAGAVPQPVATPVAPTAPPVVI